MGSGEGERRQKPAPFMKTGKRSSGHEDRPEGHFLPGARHEHSTDGGGGIERTCHIGGAKH